MHLAFWTKDDAEPEQVHWSMDELFYDLMQPKPWYKETWWWLCRKVRAIRSIPRRIGWFWQRGRRGYSDADTWSFDHYLSVVIAGGVRQLAERNFSYPCDGITAEEWKEVLHKIADGLESTVTHPYTDSAYEQWEESMDLFRRYYFDLWD